MNKEEKIEKRTDILQRISDAFLPKKMTKILYMSFFKVENPPIDINGWSINHLISGIILKKFGFELDTAIMIHTAWEIFQFIIRDNKLDMRSLIDSSLDTLFFTLGHTFIYDFIIKYLITI